MNQHPNAKVAGGTTGLAALLVWLASLEHWTIPAYAAILAAGALTTLVLFIGRNGLRGVWRRLLYGSPPPPIP